MCGCRMPKDHFIAMASDSKSHTIILQHVISMELNIIKKIAGLEIMTWNGQKM